MRNRYNILMGFIVVFFIGIFIVIYAEKRLSETNPSETSVELISCNLPNNYITKLGFDNKQECQLLYTALVKQQIDICSKYHSKKLTDGCLNNWVEKIYIDQTESIENE